MPVVPCAKGVLVWAGSIVLCSMVEPGCCSVVRGLSVMIELKNSVTVVLTLGPEVVEAPSVGVIMF